MICDDLAYGDLAVHGNPWRRPGRLDRLHAESARLTRYCSGPMCAPARVSLMTGRHYYRTGVVDTSAGRAMMHPDEVTLAELAKAAGYRT
ncbi:MAG TPA: sulfatase-like hydrolase/transferase, partial [Limnochordia bacterium]|nr:sulfatase-like hydrolase/transferase [Limnochordia bacterium]